MTIGGKYNKAGLSERDYYMADEDPCGYVTDTPCPILTAINDAIGAGLQRVLEIKENADEDSFAIASRKLNLAREMAAIAAKASTPTMELWKLRIGKVVESIG